jgi:hypothetical protein
MAASLKCCATERRIGDPRRQLAAMGIDFGRPEN